MAELKAQLYLLEKEKKALELKLSTREAQEQAYLVHIEHLKSEVEELKEQRTRSLSSTSSGGKDKAGKVGAQGPWGSGLTTCPGPASHCPLPCCLSFLICIGAILEIRKKGTFCGQRNQIHILKTSHFYGQLKLHTIQLFHTVEAFSQITV